MAATPGWYADPAGSGGKRYWDGTEWRGVGVPPASKRSTSIAGRVVLIAAAAVAIAYIIYALVSGIVGGPDRLYINKLHVHGLFAANGVDEHDWEPRSSAPHTPSAMGCKSTPAKT